jgi:hypothetical protein
MRQVAPFTYFTQRPMQSQEDFNPRGGSLKWEVWNLRLEMGSLKFEEQAFRLPLEAANFKLDTSTFILPS